MVREGPARGLSDLHAGVCVEEPLVPVCPYERLLILGGGEVLHERSSGWKQHLNSLPSSLILAALVDR